jgi:translation initiation factor IF-3
MNSIKLILQRKFMNKFNIYLKDYNLKIENHTFFMRMSNKITVVIKFEKSELTSQIENEY